VAIYREIPREQLIVVRRVKLKKGSIQSAVVENWAVLEMAVEGD
jgi:hypothetical protein